MKKLIPAFFILVISICSYGFSSNTSMPLSHFKYAGTDTTSRPPAFKDGGATIKKLKDEYNCEAIEFENQGKDDAVDSSLTICLINSKKVLPGNTEQTTGQLRAIASSIKNVLRYPQRYNSYHVVFVKRENVSGMRTVNTHTAGANISAKAL